MNLCAANEAAPDYRPADKPMFSKAIWTILWHFHAEDSVNFLFTQNKLIAAALIGMSFLSISFGAIL